MIRLFYFFCMYLLSPYLLARLWWKGRHIPAYRQRINERFAWNLPQYTGVDAWLHAVSLGEVIAATPLIEEMLKKNWRLVITTMTPTGAQRVQTAFGDSVTHLYIPYDLPHAMHRFYKKVQPRVGIIMETELWPNLVHQAKKAAIPLLLINARLSQRSFQGYKKIKCLMKPLLQEIPSILAQTPEDAQRFIDLGADASRVAVGGNIKFDLSLGNSELPIAQQLKSLWGDERIVVMLASTHADEEQQILEHWSKLPDRLGDSVLLIAPRHPERFAAVTMLSQQMGFNTQLRSQPETISPQTQVVILDCMGELLSFFKCSDYAFVGGSLVPVGGHNVLEPIAMQTPVFSGKQVHNFKSICRDLVAANAIIMVDNGQDLISAIISLHQDKDRKKDMLRNAKEVLESNKGALQRYLQHVETVWSTNLK